jgi:hypothetical protein
LRGTGQGRCPRPRGTKTNQRNDSIAHPHEILNPARRRCRQEPGQRVDIACVSGRKLDRVGVRERRHRKRTSGERSHRNRHFADPLWPARLVLHGDASGEVLWRLDSRYEPDRRRYFFGEDFGTEAAFFCAFCFLVFEVFFGLLSPMARSSLSRFRQDTNITPTTCSRHAAMDAITKLAYVVFANSSMVDSARLGTFQLRLSSLWRWTIRKVRRRG